EIIIAKDQKKRFESAGEAIPQFRIVELQYQLDRLEAARRAYRADLAAKGLLPAQIDNVEKGAFLTEIVVRAPLAEGAKLLMEVEELKVFPGEQVQAGHVLGYLSNHQNLYIEGRGFREDTPLVEKAAAEGWTIAASFPEEREASWPALDKPLKILYLAN